MVRSPKRKSLGRSKFARSKLGVAATELAIGLPLIFLLVFGSLQLSNSIQLKHLGVVITDEIAKMAVDVEIEVDDLNAEANELASSAGLRNFEVTIDEFPSDDMIEIRISIPVSDNSSIPQMFPAAMIVSSTTTYRNY